MQGLDKKNIIVVDDMTSIRVIVVKLLIGLGADENLIDEAEDGLEAFEKINIKKYDLIISDWNMPEMTGYELLKLCKAEDELKDIPFMLLTSESDKSQVIAAVKARVNEYMTKPIDKEIFFKKLSGIFK